MIQRPTLQGVVRAHRAADGTWALGQLVLMAVAMASRIAVWSVEEVLTNIAPENAHRYQKLAGLQMHVHGNWGLGQLAAWSVEMGCRHVRLYARLANPEIAMAMDHLHHRIATKL